jgi:hypothetical protein
MAASKIARWVRSPSDLRWAGHARLFVRRLRDRNISAERRDRSAQISWESHAGTTRSPQAVARPASQPGSASGPDP